MSVPGLLETLTQAPRPLGAAPARAEGPGFAQVMQAAILVPGGGLSDQPAMPQPARATPNLGEAVGPIPDAALDGPNGTQVLAAPPAAPTLPVTPGTATKAAGKVPTLDAADAPDTPEDAPSLPMVDVVKADNAEPVPSLEIAPDLATGPEDASSQPEGPQVSDTLLSPAGPIVPTSAPTAPVAPPAPAIAQTTTAKTVDAPAAETPAGLAETKPADTRTIREPTRPAAPTPGATADATQGVSPETALLPDTRPDAGTASPDLTMPQRLGEAAPLPAQSTPQAAPPPPPQPGTAPLDLTQPAWSAELVQQAEQLSTTRGDTLTLTLTPERLGTLQIRLEWQDGQAHVHIVTETPEAARALTEAQPRLAEMMTRAGLEMGSHSASNGQSGGSAGSQSDGQGPHAGAPTPEDTAPPVPEPPRDRALAPTSIDLIA